jgi:hypothetical protein
VTTGHGDAATFVIDGRAIAVQETGSTTVRISGAPEMNYRGPVGCGGRFFTADFGGGVNLYFHYSARDAYLLIGSEEYYLSGGPTRAAGRLRWDHTVNSRHIVIAVSCPRPPAGARPLLVSSVPQACTLLTPGLAAQAISQRVGPPRSVQENPELSYCEYKSLDRSFRGNRRVAVSVGTVGEITQLSSWSQPMIPGIGDEAHGGDPSIGLAARAGKRGVEVVVDRGFAASDAANLRAEEAIARRLLASRSQM